VVIAALVVIYNSMHISCQVSPVVGRLVVFPDIVGFFGRFGWAWIDWSRELLDVSSRGCHGGKMLSQE
jgi:hypothetical protein